MLHSFCFYFYVFYIAIAIREYTSHHFDVNEVLVVEIVDNKWLHVQLSKILLSAHSSLCCVECRGSLHSPELHCETGGVL